VAAGWHAANTIARATIATRAIYDIWVLFIKTSFWGIQGFKRKQAVCSERGLSTGNGIKST
jgi:hypothetical protein